MDLAGYTVRVLVLEPWGMRSSEFVEARGVETVDGMIEALGCCHVSVG